MKTYLEPARELEIAGEYDVIVVGGGPAGLAAAIASARNSVKTLLIERFGFLGGTATASLMININGFRNQVEPDGLQAVKGIAEEIIREMHKIGGLGKSPYPQKQYDLERGELSYSYCIDPEKFKFITLKLAIESGVDVLFHTYFSNVMLEGIAVGGVIVENKSGRGAYLGKITVDATGDGDVAARAGVQFWQAKKEEEKPLTDQLMYKVSSTGATEFHACCYGDSAVVWGPEKVWGNNDAREISRAEIETRLKVFDHFNQILEQNPALKAAGAYVAETPALLGIRQTRFIKGEYTLTAEDAIIGRRFPDVVAISPCPIIHYYGYRRYLTHEGYDIPYRCLVPQKAENLLIAGRCISSEQPPYESHRAMAPVMAIGQAAGTAAALCSKTGVSPRKLDINLLQKTLISQNVELRKKL
jgi:hypothetical protein